MKPVIRGSPRFASLEAVQQALFSGFADVPQHVCLCTIDIFLLLSS
jgi:hypothetical protein